MSLERLGTYMRVGQTRKGEWVALATFVQQRKGRRRNRYATFKAATRYRAIEAGEAWRLMMADKGGGGNNRGKPRLQSRTSYALSDGEVFEGMTLPTGVGVDETGPGLYLVSLTLHGNLVKAFHDVPRELLPSRLAMLATMRRR